MTHYTVSSVLVFLNKILYNTETKFIKVGTFILKQSAFCVWNCYTVVLSKLLQLNKYVKQLAMQILSARL